MKPCIRCGHLMPFAIKTRKYCKDCQDHKLKLHIRRSVFLSKASRVLPINREELKAKTRKVKEIMESKD